MAPQRRTQKPTADAPNITPGKPKTWAVAKPKKPIEAPVTNSAISASSKPALKEQPPVGAIEAPITRPSHASKLVTRNVIASVTQAGRKRTKPADVGIQPELSVKKARVANNSSAPTTPGLGAHRRGAQSSARAAAKLTQASRPKRDGGVKTVGHTKIPCVEVPPEDSPVEEPNHELQASEESDEELLIVSMNPSNKKRATVAYQHADDNLDEEASSVNGSYSPNEASDDDSGIETEDELTADKDDNDMLSQDLATLEMHLATEKPEWKGQEEDDAELPPVLRRKQTKDKGKAIALTFDNPKSATEQQLIEHPTWKLDDTPSTSDESVHYQVPDYSSIIDPIEDDQGSAGDIDDQGPVDVPNVLPPTSYELVLPRTPGAHLHLLQQHVHIMRVLQQTFLSNERTLILVNAFSPADEHHQIVVKGMLDSCADQGYTGLYTRILTDVVFCKSLAALVTDSHVIAFYGLQPGPACATKVEWLLNNLQYIYPHTYKKNMANWRQPFCNPAIPAIMHTAYWTGTSAVGLHEQDSDIVFDSSRDDRPGEQEVPAPMVALIGAAIHASLSEWKTGYHKKSFFSVDAFVDAYKELVTVLGGIKETNLNGYHFMMH